MKNAQYLEDYDPKEGVFAACSAEDDDGNPHPLKACLERGGVIIEIDVLNEWEDDHEDCIALHVKVVPPGERPINFVIAHWWVGSFELGRDYANAVNKPENNHEIINGWFPS